VVSNPYQKSAFNHDVVFVKQLCHSIAITFR
jgi:hypothetical protein